MSVCWNTFCIFSIVIMLPCLILKLSILLETTNPCGWFKTTFKEIRQQINVFQLDIFFLRLKQICHSKHVCPNSYDNLLVSESVHLSICLFVCPFSICPPLCLFVSLFAHFLFVLLTVRLSVFFCPFLFVHLLLMSVKTFLLSYPKGEQKAGEACRFAS